MPKSGKVTRVPISRIDKEARREERNKNGDVYPDKLFERRAASVEANKQTLFGDSDGESSCGDVSQYMSADDYSTMSPEMNREGAITQLKKSDQTWFAYGSDYDDAMDTSHHHAQEGNSDGGYCYLTRLT